MACIACLFIPICIPPIPKASFFATFPYFSTFFSKSQLLFAHLTKKIVPLRTYDHRFASCNRLTIVGIQNYEIHIFRNPVLVGQSPYY